MAYDVNKAFLSILSDSDAHDDVCRDAGKGGRKGESHPLPFSKGQGGAKVPLE